MPFLCDTADDLFVFPPISIFDLYNDLKPCKDFDHASMRDVTKMEGYQMLVERYVQFVSPGIFPETDKHCFVIAHVKPRTNDKDPIAKLPYYKLWTIFDKHDLHTSIYSANCTCKGGSDGYCRHVVATIF